MNEAFTYLESSFAMTAEDYKYNEHYVVQGQCAYDETLATFAKVKTYT